MLLGLQVILDDQPAAHGAADEHGADQAEGGGGSAHQLALVIAHLHKGAAIGQSRAVSADHGDGAGQQGIGGGQAHRSAHGDADDVLEDGDDAGGEPIDNQQHAALFQQGEAGAQAHGGEEGQHKGILEGVGEVEGEGVGGISGPGDEHEQEAAHHGGGDAVFI